MAENAYFGFPRVTEQFPTLSGGSWRATYPLTNLQSLPLSQVARSLDATTGSTSIVATASSPQSCSVVALAGHNMTQAATIRVRTWTDTAGTTGLVDSSAMNVWAASYTAAEVAGTLPLWFYRFADPGPATVGKMQIDITDTANPDGYVEAGYLEIAAAFDATYNFAPGAQYGLRWRSLAMEAIGGAAYIDRRDHPRVWKCEFQFTPRDDALDKFYELQRQHGMHQPVLFVPLPSETNHLLRTAMFARLLDPGLSTMRFMSASGLIDSVLLSLEEVIG